MTINLKMKFVMVLFLGGLAGLFCSSLRAQDADIAVVVNSSNPVSNLTMGELRKVLAGEKRTWPGGTSVKILVRASGSRERNALLKILGMNEDDYKQYWTSQVYRGDAQAEPPVLPSIGMMREAVVAYRGSIALVDSREIKAGMKVLKVDGHAPGETGYPLR